MIPPRHPAVVHFIAIYSITMKCRLVQWRDVQISTVLLLIKTSNQSTITIQPTKKQPSLHIGNQNKIQWLWGRYICRTLEGPSMSVGWSVGQLVSQSVSQLVLLSTFRYSCCFFVLFFCCCIFYILSFLYFGYSLHISYSWIQFSTPLKQRRRRKYTNLY